MTCTVCGVDNDLARKFCRECGARLAVACAECGHPNAPGDKFCGECGSVLVAAEPRPAAPVAPSSTAHPEVTERRLVSVLFVDLVGFTSYSEGRDAEDVRGMLTRYFDAATDAVQRHGGVVEKFIGDAVMAVWGTPVAHEDDAERAVRSALEIVDRVAAIGDEIGVQLRARAGILTGEAVAQLDAVGQGIVTGDLVNTASRLQSAAEPGSVIVGERTYRSTSGSIAYAPIDPLTLKGKTDQVKAWKVLRVLSEMRGGNRGAAPEPPFLGRDGELRMMKEVLHATTRDGRARLLHLSGVAGIGKSRLVWELLKYVDGLTETVFWHHGRCPSYGEGVTFWAFAEMVRARAGIQEGDDAGSQWRKLRDVLDRFVPSDDERAWMEPHLAHLLGIGSATVAPREELFGAWRSFVERIADAGTTVLVFEDLQWADAGLLDFVESLLEWSRTSPILVLSMSRPELIDRRDSWGVGVRNASTLHLDRLADDEIRALVTGYVEGLPDEGLDRLVQRAEGVPMYAVETVRMLADRGVLEQVGEAYQVVGELGRELDVPETLHALVAARLDALPDAERVLVQDASVAGHSFTLEAVAAVSGRRPEELEPLLRTLARKEVLDQDVDPRSPERGQYRFVQSVIREVAYSTMTKSVRRAKHLAAAAYLERLDEDDLAGVVATHYLEAYRADPSADDAESVAVRARTALASAGDRAFALGSPAQALAFAEQALDLATAVEDRAPLLKARVVAGRYSGSDRDLWRYTSEALDAYRALDDIVGETAVLQHGSVGTWQQGIAREIVHCIEDSIGRAGSEHPAELAMLQALLANRLSQAGRWEEADTSAESALVLAQTLPGIEGSELMYRCVSMRAWTLAQLGRWYESRVLWDAGIILARDMGSPAVLAEALMQRSLVLWGDDLLAACGSAQESLEIGERIGNRALVDANIGNLVEAFADLGRWDEADHLLERGRSQPSLSAASAFVLDLCEAQMAMHRGADQRAAEIVESAVTRASDDSMGIQLHTWALRMAGLHRLLLGQAEQALALARDGLTLDANGANAPQHSWLGILAAGSARDIDGMRDVVDRGAAMKGRWMYTVRSTAAAALTAMESGPSDEAVAEWTQVLRAWDELGYELDRTWALLCAGWTLGAEHVDPDEVARARDYLEGLGAVALLQRFDAAGLVV